MHRCRLPLTAVALLTLAAELRAQDEAKAVLDRAIQALGGADKLGQLKAVHTNIKGTIYSAKSETLPFTADTWSGRSGQFKHHMLYDREGILITQVQMFNGDAVGVWVNGADYLNDKVKAALKKGRYADELTNLLPLRDKAFTLELAGERKEADGRVLIEVKVTRSGCPDVSLFFDKNDDLLYKTAHRQLDPSSKNEENEMLQEVVYRDYREPDLGEQAEKTLREARFTTDGPALLDILRKRTLPGNLRDKIAILIQQLADESFEVRENASKELAALGAVSVPLLKQAVKSTDPEVVRRAERCLEEIKEGPVQREANPAIPRSAARLIALRKPVGAAEVLLAYLLMAPDEQTAGEVRGALAAVAFRDGQADQFLTQALEDKDSQRRAAAAEALGKSPRQAPGRTQFIQGLKRPTNVTIYRGGRKFMEWQLLAIDYYNAFDDSLFAKP